MSQYFVKCKLCYERKFKTLYSLTAHYDNRHANESEIAVSDHSFYNSEGHVVEVPVAAPISTTNEQNYSKWLFGLAKRINNSPPSLFTR